MNYKMIRIAFREAKDRLNRTILVREDINLEELGIIIGTSFNASFEHAFNITDKKIIYTTHDDEYIDDERVLNGGEYGLDDLNDNFVFTYDFGDDWIFDCKKYKKIVTKESDDYCYLVDGKGQGIWEDEKYYLMEYLNGNISPQECFDDEGEGFCGPWNFEDECYGDFDTEFNLEEESEDFNERAIENMYQKQNDMFDNQFKGPFEDNNLNITFFVFKASLDLISDNEEIAHEIERIQTAHSDMREYAISKLMEEYAHEYYLALANDRNIDEDEILKKIKEIK